MFVVIPLIAVTTGFFAESARYYLSVPIMIPLSAPNNVFCRVDLVFLREIPGDFDPDAISADFIKIISFSELHR